MTSPHQTTTDADGRVHTHFFVQGIPSRVHVAMQVIGMAHQFMMCDADGNDSAIECATVNVANEVLQRYMIGEMCYGDALPQAIANPAPLSEFGGTPNG